MGIFTRFKDIISSNLNAMLDKAEDPEKLIKMMIQEMEDTLIEIKASCAGVMANKANANRALDEARLRATDWEGKAKLAISKGRDDLAREALAEKKRFQTETERFEKESVQLDEMVAKYKSDITELETKIATAREKHHALIRRHSQAQKRQNVQNTIRKANASDAFVRFEAFENRIDRMEAGVDLVNAKSKPTLEEEFSKLEGSDDLDLELAKLKDELKNKDNND